MSDYTGLPSIWEDIKKYLVVSTVVEEATVKNDLPLLITFIVTNTAQSQVDQPEILFEEVILKVGISPDWRQERAASLAGGQSFQYQYRCRYSDLQKVQYSIEGKLSPLSLFQVKQRTGTVTARQQTLPIESYIGFLEEVNVYKWIDDVFRKVKIPGPETTIADIEAQKSILNRAAQDIQDVGKHLHGIISFIKMERNRDDILRHKQLVDEYLRRTLEGCGRLANLFSTPSRGRELEGERDQIITRLTKETDKLKQATDDLVKSK